MRGSWPSLFTILVLIAMSICSACVFQPQENQTPQTPPPNASPKIDVGIVPIEVTPEPVYISFDEARGNLGDSEPLSLNKFLIKTRFLFIRGGNLDESGNARHWIFGANKGNTNELRIYDATGWTIIPWNSTISAEEIDFNRIVSPETIFNQSGNQILESSPSEIPVQRDIALKNGTYEISITSENTSQVLRFNASTGAAIE